MSSSQHGAGSLSGRVALITGASSGIGAATARAFAGAGANLVLNGRDATRLQNVADSISKNFPSVQVATLVGDTGVEATHKALVDLALSRFGALHIAFNNAGIYPTATIETITSEQIDALYAINVKGIIYALKYQLPALGKSASKDNWGVIVNNSSVVSTYVRSGIEPFGVYASTKAAVDTLTRFGALEGASKFVRVTAVNVGFTGSEGAFSGVGGSEEEFQKIVQRFAIITPALTTDEAAQSVLFLADNRTARFINGNTFVIDGGISVK